jgi:subtilase family serine protease
VCRATFGTDCLSPADLRAAYHLGPLYGRGITGKGRTIAIVDSFGSPTIAADLHAFDVAFHIPDPPRLTIIQPAGPVPPFDGSDDRIGWAGETTLDVEWAHALAPGASILLVETPTSETEDVNGFPEIVKAERYVIQHHLAEVISQSFGATEPTFTGGRAVVQSLSRQMYPLARKAGITVVASSGDAGATDFTRDQTHLYSRRVDSWPSTDPLVTSVGGTRVQLDGQRHRVAPDSAWGGTNASGAGGGGLSEFFTRPAFQNGVRSVVHNRRGTPDISMNASGLSPVLTYQSYDSQSDNWGTTWGTSASAPLFAAIVALADQSAGRRLGWLNPALYTLARSPGKGIVDVTRGSSDLAGGSGGTGGDAVFFRGYRAARGYDLATGLGTIDAARFVPALVAALRHR